MAEPINPKQLKQDPLVDRLRPDPSQPPVDAIALTGYLGKGTAEQQWRLYMTPRLNEFVEIAEADILSQESMATEQNPLAPSRVWVKHDAKLAYTRLDSRQVQAEFLKGEITRGFLPRAEPGRPQQFIADRIEHYSKLDLCYSVGYEWFCTWGINCTKDYITCTWGPPEAHRTDVVACTPREN